MLYNFFVLSPLGTRSKYKDKNLLNSRDIFRTQSNIYDGAFLEKSLIALNAEAYSEPKRASKMERFEKKKIDDFHSL